MKADTKSPSSDTKLDVEQWHEWRLYEQRMGYFRRKLAAGQRLNRDQLAIFQGPPPQQAHEDIGQ